MEQGKRAVVYGRVSRVAKRRNGPSEPSMSVDSQISESLSWVEREGCVLIADPYRDDGVSASPYATKDREQWPLVFGHIKAGDTDLLVVWEISRATRDRPVWAALMAACQTNNVCMVVGGVVHDPNDPDDAFMLDLLASLAVRESGIISKRNNRLVRARADAGKPHGSITYGYRSEYDSDTGRLVRRVINPDTAAVVRQIADWALAGKSMWWVANVLNERGVPSPQGAQWRGTNIWKLICNPAYIGKRVFQGDVYGDATWPAILTAEQHNRLLVIGSDPSRRHNHEGTRVKHLLVGIAEAQCGVRVQVQSGGRTRKPAYTCTVDFCTSRTVHRVDDLVHRLMAARLSQPDIVEALSRLDSNGEAQLAAAQVADLRRRLDEYYDQAADSTPADERLSAAGLARIEAKLLAQIKQAEQRARPASLPSVVWDVAGPDAEARWHALDVLDQRAVVKALCRVIIHRGAKGGAAPFDPSLIDVRWRE